jgi:radical SAM-linked protein
VILRFRFSKLGKVRWISHRDFARVLERALRRARLPLAYTQGFSPRPRLSFGLALPTGCESSAEYVDVTLGAAFGPEDAAELLRPALPAGIGLLACGVLEPGSGSLQEEVTSCAWEITVPPASRNEVDQAVARVLAAPSLPVERERKGRRVSDDLRPSLLSLAVRGAPSGGDPPQHPEEHSVALLAELGTRPRGVRPAELARVMRLELGPAKRTCQWIERDGSKFEPLDLPLAVPACVGERAS